MLIYETYNEGIDIDRSAKQVYLNDEHNDVVNTNSTERPTMFKTHKRCPAKLDLTKNPNSCLKRGYDIYSIFERTYFSNLFANALKGRKGWTFGDEADKKRLFRRAVYALENQTFIFDVHSYDTIIMVPSSNDLNNMIFSYLKRIVPNSVAYDNLFAKLKAKTVWRSLNWNMLSSSVYNDPEKLQWAYEKLRKAFLNMEKNNDGYFSYKYIMPLSLRKVVSHSMKFTNANGVSKSIKGKRVLVIDDIVASGNTSTDTAILIDKYQPAKIDFLTLLSDKKKPNSSSRRRENWLLGANYVPASHQYRNVTKQDSSQNQEQPEQTPEISEPRVHQVVAETIKRLFKI